MKTIEREKERKRERQKERKGEREKERKRGKLRAKQSRNILLNRRKRKKRVNTEQYKKEKNEIFFEIFSCKCYKTFLDTMEQCAL